MPDVLIVIRSDTGVLHKITKLCPYKGKAFAAMVPYHSAREGLLIKQPIRYDRHLYRSALNKGVLYTADDQVKLSVHFSGFVQFSGVNGGRIESGRHKKTREPKGIGIVGPPIKVDTGPLFGIQVWGLDQFDTIDTPRKSMCEFVPEDIKSRVVNGAVSEYGYHLEFLLLPRILLNGQTIGPRGAIVWANVPVRPQRAFRKLRVIEIDSPAYFLGCLVTRPRFNLPGDSGFALQGPSAFDPKTRQHMGISAIYPRFDGINNKATRLDRAASKSPNCSPLESHQGR